MRTCGFYTKYLYQILLYCTEWGMHPHLLPFLFPPTSHLHKTLDKVKNPPFMPSYQQQIYFFSSLKSAVLCLYQGCTRREKKKDWRGKPRNPVESVLAVGKKCQKLFKVCNSHFSEPPKQQMSTKVGMTCEAGRDRMKKSPGWGVGGVKSNPRLAL